ncbi:hypothetical protein BASA50_010309 [Batrachochytrium salamandrivorans]|uniref:Uncharacterized protein n=1 Tax=Batrachochytrium salamandrivorans TaxID=1357716 RepID=A0ABQ8EZC7_9FUNG|nr:hypothetical protein BASA62_007630 [Batrachochytrium salamandrivorans]KAH6565883.1 hypothetical protein BASA60_009742 [Batrachochytrium salamandrivorans]KAH6589025.1 hypothetical protein BASA50_010309 [Batrachochytrium salamandrivorans]KAH6593599.1 hypothetical protein BASA61_004248 [Batrachochytrium salamandrivorans]KAH9263907.1 hypothetical protein BASA83_012651 [Batrachochytrium salamandrivorans]
MQWFINFVAKDKARSMTVIITMIPVAVVTGYISFERLVLGKKQRSRDELGQNNLLMDTQPTLRVQTGTD